MSKHQPLKLTKAQERALVKIKKGSDLRKNITAFCTMYSLDYNKVHARWYYLTVTSKGKAKARNASKPAKDGIIAYKLEKDVNLTVRVETAERTEKLKKLIPQLLKLGVKKYAVPIYKADITAMREVFKETELASRVFGITAIKDNPNMVRVYRKS